MTTWRAGTALRLICALWAGIMSALWVATSTRAQEANLVLFYDPDTNFDAIAEIVSQWNNHLAAAVPGFQIKAMHDLDTFRESLASTRAKYVIVPSSYTAQQTGQLTPLLVPTSAADGAPYYHKVLVVGSAGGQSADLAGKTIATTSLGSGGGGGGGYAQEDADTSLLAALRAARVNVEGSTLLRVSNDIDALLALQFGQVGGALVTMHSLGVVQELIPASAARLKVVWKSEKILRTPFCAVNRFEDKRDREKMLDALRTMSATQAGRNAMESLGIQGWMPFEPQLAERT